MAKKFETMSETYISQESIGSGGSGNVYKAKDSAGVLYAVKVLNMHTASADKVRRFKQEISYCQRSEQRNVITVVDVGFFQDEDNKIPFYVMPLYSYTLRDLIGKKIAKSEAEVLSLYLDLLSTFSLIHKKGVIHRDVKPENILYDATADELIIADFGIAHFTADDLITVIETKDSNRLANFAYASPEQRKPGSNVDHRADIYSLGLILNELFTRKVIQGEGYKKISDTNSEFAFLDAVVAKMVMQSPDDRYQNIGDAVNDIEALNSSAQTARKIEELRAERIKASTEQDELISNPIQISTINWGGNCLIFRFSGDANDLWMQCFRRVNSGVFSLGYRPNEMNLAKGHATMSNVSTDASFQKRIVESVKRHIEYTNGEYAKTVEKNRKIEEEKLVKQHRNAIQQAEEARSINDFLAGLV